MSKFYTYHQNNSGGSFIVNDRVAQYVIIEAEDAAHADARATGLGIYFNGCEDGSDCECCGDRWSPAWEGDADEVPSIYGKPVDEYLAEPPNSVFWFAAPGAPYVYVHRLSGQVDIYRVPSEKPTKELS